MRYAMLLLVLVGCAGQEAREERWIKPAGGGSQAELSADDGQCKAQAFAIPNAPTMQVAMVYNACMQGKGWAREAK